jgi:hypothetical protein
MQALAKPSVAWGYGALFLRRAYQAAAWAFMVSLLFRSLVGDLEDALNHAPEPSAAHGLVILCTGPYVAIKAALFLFAVGGLFTTLSTREQPINGQGQ